MTQAKGNQRKGFEDSVGIEEFRGKYRFNFSRKLSRQYWGKTQQRMSTGLTVCKENHGKVEEMAWKIHYDVLSDNFSVDDLTKYGLGEKPPNLTVITPIKKQLTILEIYDTYCESRVGTMAETTLKLKLKGQFRRAITQAINAVGEDALAIRNWLVENRCPKIAQECLRNLDKGYQLCIKHKGLTYNPFTDMASEIQHAKNKNQINKNFDNESQDNNIKTFTIGEMNAIIKAFESSGYRRHLAPIIKFLFWTGCRTGEAIGLKWRDIKWDRELIAIRRTYNDRLRIFKPTKAGTIRFFPMPKDGQLWNLLKSIPERESDDIVFVSKGGQIIDITGLGDIWRGTKNNNEGVIPKLIKEGKVSQYLKLYATRHTFISHQVNIHKIPITTVAQWVGNGAMVSNNSYLDRDKMTVPGYSIVPSEATESRDSRLESEESNQHDDDSNQKMANFVAGLTPEQREQFKALLNKQ